MFHSMEYIEVKDAEITFGIQRSIANRTESLDLSYDNNDVLLIEGVKLIDLSRK